MTADAERSAAVLRAAGFRVVVLADLAPWQLLAVTSQGLTLVAAVEAA